MIACDLECGYAITVIATSYITLAESWMDVFAELSYYCGAGGFGYDECGFFNAVGQSSASHCLMPLN